LFVATNRYVSVYQFTIILLVLFFTAFPVRSYGQSGEASEDRLTAISQRTASLAQRAAQFWLTHGVDWKYGGFHGKLDKSGNPSSPTSKFIIQQSRHLWSFSEWYHDQEENHTVKDVCDMQFEFLKNKFLISSSGEFRSHVNRDGSPLKNELRQYFQSFGIYAMSNYARVFKNEQAAEIALACFRSIDKRAHDDEHGGYSQKPEYKNGNKDTNTQMHLMEAFTALYELTGDSLVRLRLNEMMDLMVEKVIDPRGYGNAVFDRAWNPINTKNPSYGHDIELAWLILDAARALGRMEEENLRETVGKFGETISRNGFDSNKGGYYHVGDRNGKVIDRTKVWWVQAEAVAGLWWTWILTKDAVHLSRLEKTLDWIENYQISKKLGAWYGYVSPNGGISGSNNLGYDWKASYHNMRAMIYLGRWIGEYLAGQKVSAGPFVIVRRQHRVASKKINLHHGNPYSNPCCLNRCIDVSGRKFQFPGNTVSSVLAPATGIYIVWDIVR
jgi:mannobiose 2-epimerase